MKTQITTLFALLCCCLMSCNKQTPASSTADYNIVPFPQEITMEDGDGFELNGKTVIAYSGDEAMKRNAELLAEYIKDNTGLELAVSEGEATQSNAISLAIGNATEN